jgi:hypothetical protein
MSQLTDLINLVTFYVAFEKSLGEIEIGSIGSKGFIQYLQNTNRFDVSAFSSERSNNSN